MPAEQSRSDIPVADPLAIGTSGFHSAVPPARPHVEARPTGARLAFLSLAALGVVYGDIGTSPLYALRECLRPEYGITPGEHNVYGVLSLIVWALILIVSVKYIAFIMRADNRGEGGILALLALLMQDEHKALRDTRDASWLVVLGLFGASAPLRRRNNHSGSLRAQRHRRVQIAAPHLPTFIVVGSTVIILLFLFGFQRYGTARVGGLFGPIMAVWFITIAGLGLIQVAHDPTILSALNPWWSVQFFVTHGRAGFLVLGAVVLAVTGAEALYADMGHFGRRPIRMAWFVMVFPALLLNYFGQGALLLHNPAAAENPFFLLAPHALLYPLVVIATLAAIIAFASSHLWCVLAHAQSVQLGYSPRVTIVHTSNQQAGQIYIPEVNKLLRLGCILLVLLFQTSAALTAAYGIAVTGTMAITSLLFYVVARSKWGWPVWQVALLTAAFLVIDCSLLGTDLVKIASGGWVPVVLAIAIFTLMSTWKRGRLMLQRVLHEGSLPSISFWKTSPDANPHAFPVRPCS